MLRQGFVLIAIVHFYYGIYYDLSYIKFPPAYLKGGFFDAISRFKYLTFWNMVRSDDYIVHTNIFVDMLTYIKVCVRMNNVIVVKNVIVTIPCNRRDAPLQP
jgi:hypothetical protein